MIKKILIWTAVALSLALAALVVVSLLVSRPLFDEQLNPATLHSIAIAPADQALTFARYRADGQLRTLLVTKYERAEVFGLDTYRQLGINDDPIALFATLGYEALERAANSGAPQEVVAVQSLEIPFETTADNIGIGTNYVEHARESQVEEKPFVFPKLVQPTHFNARVPQGNSRLLDYEAELGFVALDDLSPDSPPQRMGLVLANDFTDRWSLVLNFDGDTEMGTTGFVEGKSREAYAPIGNLLVIPKNLDAFYRQVELNLYVNGRLRQREKAGAMVWGPVAMLQEIFRRESWTFRRYDGTVPLLPRAKTIPQRTIIFSGTPAGVIFKPANVWNHWAYLQSGHEVLIRSEHLGMLRNKIID
ncbi:MAG: fumarylacetoacetate hydrolase family protein [Nevskiales bacterium]